MKNFKKALHILIRLATLNKTIIGISLTFILLGFFLITISAFNGDLSGEEDYFISIASCSMSITFMCLFGILGLTIQNSKFFHSTPDAEYITTKLIPILTMLSTMLISAFALVLTAISVNIGITDGNRISDLLLILAWSSALGIIASGLNQRRSTIIVTYGGMVPFIFCIFIDTENSTLQHIYRYGLEVPVYISAIIYAAAIILAFLFSLKLAKSSYKKRSTFFMVTSIQI